MAVIDNTTFKADIDVVAREVDFVTQLNQTNEHYRQILNIMRPIRKAPGTELKSRYAEVKDIRHNRY